MLKAVGMAVVTEVVTEVVTVVAMVMLPRRILTARRINLFMHSRRTATAAESVSDLATITAPGTTAVTAGTTEVTAGIMVETTADMAGTTADMVAMAVDTTDITESMETNRLFGLVRLGKFNLPSLPDES